MSYTTEIQMRIDKELKEKAEALFNERKFNKETHDALEEAKSISNDRKVNSYNNLDELFSALEK